MSTNSGKPAPMIQFDFMWYKTSQHRRVWAVPDKGRMFFLIING